MGRNVDAEHYLRESASICIEIGDENQASTSLAQLAMVLMSRGHVTAARSSAEQALPFARTSAGPRELSNSLNALGEVCRAEGDLAAAQRSYQEALNNDRITGAGGNAPGILANLAAVMMARNEPDRAFPLIDAGAD